MHSKIYLLLAVLAAAGIVLQAFFIMNENKRNYAAATVLKGCASLVFVAVGAVCLAVDGRGGFRHLLLAGLLFGAVGDLLLNLRLLAVKREKLLFLAGTAVFLLGHVMYFIFLVQFSENLPISIAAGAAAAVIVLIFMNRLLKVGRIYRIFGIFYVGVEAVTTAAAVGLFIGAPQHTGTAMFAAGALAFFASDILLIFNNFGPVTRDWVRTADLSLYYIGQLLIAFSLLFII